MEFNIDTFHPFVLNIGLAQHNADWNWKNVSSPFFRTPLLCHRRFSQNYITRPYRVASQRIHVFYSCIYIAQL